jgi:hypothetical protein
MEKARDLTELPGFVPLLIQHSKVDRRFIPL